MEKFSGPRDLKDTETVVTIWWRDKYAHFLVEDYATMEAALSTVPHFAQILGDLREAVEQAAVSGGAK